MLLDHYNEFLTALCIWREARSASQDARRAVLCVINNRVAEALKNPAKAKQYGGTTQAQIVLMPYQFSSFNKTDPNAVLLPKPIQSSDWAAWQECCSLLDTPVDEDPTGGAQFYHSYQDPADKRWPSWAEAEKMTARIGPFRFYKL